MIYLYMIYMIYIETVFFCFAAARTRRSKSNNNIALLACCPRKRDFVWILRVHKLLFCRTFLLLISSHMLPVWSSFSSDCSLLLLVLKSVGWSRSCCSISELRLTLGSRLVFQRSNLDPLEEAEVPEGKLTEVFVKEGALRLREFPLFPSLWLRWKVGSRFICSLWFSLALALACEGIIGIEGSVDLRGTVATQ